MKSINGIPNQAANEILIYCEDASHPDRRVFVAAFESDPSTPFGWFHRRDRGQRTLLVDNDPVPDGPYIGRSISAHHLLPGEHGESSYGRTWVRLVCRKCKRRPVDVREDRLEFVLTAMREHGVSSLALTALASKLGRTGEKPVP